MARKPTQTLTDGELRLMCVLWASGPSTVLEIQDALEDDLVDSTIRTLLRILEVKGYVKRRKEGRAFRYHPLVDQEETKANVLDHMLQRFFHTPGDLVLSLLKRGELDEAELARIRKALSAKRKEKQE
jgi:predicted transcriptional regulator